MSTQNKLSFARINTINSLSSLLSLVVLMLVELRNPSIGGQPEERNESPFVYQLLRMLCDLIQDAERCKKRI